MDKLKPVVKHKSKEQETVTTNRTVPTGYAVEVFNAILQQEAENAAVSSGIVTEHEGTHVAAWTVSDKKMKHECRFQKHDAVNHPTNTAVAHDVVNHPSHYCQGGIECIDAIEAAVTGLRGMDAVCAGNAIKYIWRYHQKNGVEDLKKARFYLNKLILLTERKDDTQ